MCASRDADQTASAVNVFVTGQPGIGKTTLVLNVAKQLPQDCIAGFYTQEARAPGTGERLGLDVVTFSGERVPLCRLRRGCGPKIGKYYVALSEFERVVIPQLTPSKKIKLHIIDEIGRLELCSPKFKEAITTLLNSPRAVFGSIPAPRYGHTLEEVERIKQRPDTAVLTLTRANRGITAQEVTELLKRLIQDARDQDEDEEEGEQGEGLGENGSTEKQGWTVPSVEEHQRYAGHKGEEQEHQRYAGHKGESSQRKPQHGSSSSEHTPVPNRPLEAALAQVADAILGD